MLADPAPPVVTPAIQARLDELLDRLQAAHPRKIGFPDATDFDYTPLAPFLRYLLNNLGDPDTDGAYPQHTKPFEREVIAAVADLLRAPADDRWGYVTSGASQGTLAALHIARGRYPNGVVYHSQTAHYAITQAVELLAMPSITVRAQPDGEIDYDDLAEVIAARRERPAIVVANTGTLQTEAVDDVRRITTVLNELAVRRRFIHSDAALSGLPLALLGGQPRPGFDFADGADSVIISGHKFIGAPFPCGVLVVKASHRTSARIAYTASGDGTIGCSRNGLAALALWYAIESHGMDGLRRRAEQARELADYTVRRLVKLGWEAWRYPHACTVVLRTPPAAVTNEWVLVGVDGWSRIVCMPGMSDGQIDALLRDLQAARRTAASGRRGRLLRGRHSDAAAGTRKLIAP